MKPIRFSWTVHRWTALTVALFFMLISITGLLLLLKKRVEWIQPPTQAGAAGDVSELLPLQEVLKIALDQGHPDFATLDDIDRIDFRLGERVHKIRSAHHHAEMQIDAITGEVLSIDVRNSDLLEDLHDGSWFGELAHNWLWPVLSMALLTLVLTGLWMWASPRIKRSRSRARKRAGGS
jgi:uncharacterized iron-regulated membrane protein